MSGAENYIRETFGEDALRKAKEELEKARRSTMSNIDRNRIESWADPDQPCLGANDQENARRIRELSRMLCAGYRPAIVTLVDDGQAMAQVSILGGYIEHLQVGHQTPGDVRVNDRGFAFYGEIRGGHGWHFVR